MARNCNGWFLVSRRLFEPDKQNNEFYGDPAKTLIWLQLLAWASFKPGKKVARGEVLTSHAELGAVFGYSVDVVRRVIFALRNARSVSTKRTDRGMVITILNYDKYQDPKNETPDQIPISSPIRSRSGPDILNKVNKDKELNKRINKGCPRPSLGAPVWDAYASEFEKRFKRQPLRNAAVNSMCKKIAEMVGQEDGVALVRFYVTHPKPFYAAKSYDLRYLVSDLQALHGEMKDGRPRVAAIEPPKRPIDIGPAMTYQPESPDFSCPKCSGSGLLKRLDEQGIPYRCGCKSFIARGLDPALHAREPESLNRVKAMMERIKF